MHFKFTKMHSLGNDYIIINGFEYHDLLHYASQLSIRMSDRHFGVGGDGIIFVLPSVDADAKMRIFNSDGSEAQMCGNGIRQVAKFLYDNRLVHKREMAVETLAGIKPISLVADESDRMIRACVNMGMPILEPKSIPAIADLNGDEFAKIRLDVEDKNLEFTLVSMGNPHAVTFVDEVSDWDVAKYGKPVEHNTAVFPQRTNVEFIQVLNKTEIKMRVWERGSGETFACGTGASASVVAGVLNNLLYRSVIVYLPAGELEVEWLNNGSVMMTGDAEVAFTGDADSVYFMRSKE